MNLRKLASWKEIAISTFLQDDNKLITINIQQIKQTYHMPQLSLQGPKYMDTILSFQLYNLELVDQIISNVLVG